MKHQLLTFVTLLAFAFGSYAQRTCQTMDVLERLIIEDPGLQERMNQIETHAQNTILNKTQANNGVITIPVVVHVLYNNSSENISDAQIMSQIAVLNEDFRRMNADKTNTPSSFAGVASDVEIEFCLATIDPNGNPTTGITRTQTSKTFFIDNDDMKYTASGGIDTWGCSNYLNIWVCDLDEFLGYAQFPGGPCATDGIVCDYAYFGTIGTATFPYDLGRTATHEVGHWLNLRHIWGDGGCSVDDFVADTPLAGAPNFTGAPCTFPGPNTCFTGTGDLPDMFQNYMDYSADACMNLFTTGQKTRMRALFDVGGFRESLLSSTACGATPTIATGLNFDGVDDKVQLGPIGVTGAISIEAWVKPSSKNNFLTILTTKSAGLIKSGFLFAINEFNSTNGKLVFETNNAAVFSNASVTWNVWQHVAFTYDGTTPKMYINGVDVGVTLFNAGVDLQASTEPAYIGHIAAFSPLNGNFLGSMDELRVWSMSKSGPELLANKDCALSGNEAGLVAYYNFDNGLVGANNAGLTTLTDQTANSNDGTLSNFALSGPTSNWVEGASISGVCQPFCPITNSFSPIWINSAYKAAGAINVHTYYWGLSNGTITAQPMNGVGPYTYQWSSNEGYIIKNSTQKRVRLWYPTGPQWVTVEITDVGAGCTIEDSVYIDWVDFTCNQPSIWFYELCNVNTGVTSCVQGTINMRNLVGTGDYVYGPCGVPKTDWDIANGETIFDVELFPNPNTGQFSYELTSSKASSYVVTVLDLNGRVLYSETVDNTYNNTIGEVNLSQLSAGMYLFQIANENNHAVKRFVIQ